ncbi:hypothetical protein [Nonomuraea sp. NPDC048916]|uniref:hypothetical protein n=1 Tax=Nonomuraea sp. NPDC048916 TaxID=3154232 RepID=UPI0033F692D5
MNGAPLDAEADPWPCPRLSAHPPRHSGAPVADIDWTKPQPVRLRVVDHTCSCRVVVYELLSCGGHYMIRRLHQTDPPKSLYAGPWPRPVAERVWKLVLTGEAW